VSEESVSEHSRGLSAVLFVLALASLGHGIGHGWLGHGLYKVGLLAVPLLAGARFARPGRPTAGEAALGVGLGLLSGLTGVGGGIYLSPILLLLGWKDVKATAGVSAAFIFVNSATSLAGRAARGDLPNAAFLPLLVAAVLGGALGARWGADRAAPTTLRRLLGAVLLLAAGKLLFA